MVFWDRNRNIRLVMFLVLLFILVSQINAAVAPIKMLVAGSGNGSSSRIAPPAKLASVAADHPVVKDKIEDSVLLQSLGTVFHTIQDQPDADQAIVSTYQKEECFRFLQVAFGRADLDLQTVLSESAEVSFFRNGDLIKLDHSVYRGLSHWGIYWDGYIMHNWDGFHRDPSGVFLTEYADPGSTFHIFHPSFPHSPGSRLVIFQ